MAKLIQSNGPKTNIFSEHEEWNSANGRFGAGACRLPIKLLGDPLGQAILGANVTSTAGVVPFANMIPEK